MLEKENKDEKSIKVETKKEKLTFPSRQSMSRLISFQILYQMEFLENIEEKINFQEAYDVVVKNFIQETYRIKNLKQLLNREFIENLVNNTKAAKNLIKQDIESFLKEDYTLENIPRDLRILLLLATYEIKFSKDTPARVIISEYTDIAASLLKKKQVNFINAILNNISNKVREGEI